MKKYIGELIGSFFIVFTGIGSLLGINFMVSAMGLMLPYGFSTFLAAASFGATTAVMYYVFNKVTGGHFNPAVTLAVFIEDGVKHVKDLFLYIVSQIIGSTVAVLLIGFMTAQTKNLGQVGFGEISPLYMGVIPAVVAEFLLTIFVVLVFLTARDKKLKGETTDGGAAAAVGTSVFAAYSFCILATGGGLNPAKIFASAIVARGTALTQLPIFFFVPLVASVFAFLIFRGFVKADENVKDVDKVEAVEQLEVAENEVEPEDDKVETKVNSDTEEIVIKTDESEATDEQVEDNIKDDDLKNSTNEEIQAMLDEEILATTKEDN